MQDNVWIQARVAQKRKPLPNDQKIVLNRTEVCQWDKIYSSNESMNQAL